MASKIDKRSGSISYNRLDMQISQALHFAIELYDSLDYLLVLDYYDDITLFDNENNEGIVSYYQMKTNDNSITLNSALKEGWLDKLYAHLLEPDIFVKELGLITNCTFKVNGQVLNADKTPLLNIKKENIIKIKEDIAKRNHLSVDEVDLTKFVHIKTTLSIDRHSDIVEKETNDFLLKMFPQIKLQTVKTIFNSIITLLGHKQQYEKLSDDATFIEVKNKKGFTKKTFEKIIVEAIKISLPEYDKIRCFANIPEELNGKAALAYTQILSDNNSNSPVYVSTFDLLNEMINENAINLSESLWNYTERCKEIFRIKKPQSMYLLSDSLYINILIICILMNR